MNSFTRRQALIMAVGLPLPLWAFAAKEFWDAKPPAQWTEAERSRLTEDSPWARPAVVSIYGEPGSVRAPNANARAAAVTAAGGTMQNRPGSLTAANNRTMTLPRESTAAQPRFEATVRWVSAAPMLAALKGIGEAPDFEQYYVLQVSGDIPGLGGPRKDDTDDDLTKEGTVEMLKQYTRLEHKGKPVFLEKIEPGPAAHPGALFFFSRAEEIKLDDKQVNFSTKMGPLEVKAHFVMKDMIFGGKLAL